MKARHLARQVLSRVCCVNVLHALRTLPGRVKQRGHNRVLHSVLLVGAFMHKTWRISLRSGL